MHLKKCIKSIEKQSYRNYEVLIMDNCSSDSTLDFLKTLKEPFFYFSERDKGIYDAMNKGIEKSKGEWVYFMGADDTLYNEFVLEKLFNSLNNESFKLIIGKIKYNYKRKDSVFLKLKKGIFKSEWNSFIWVKNTIHHQSVFYKKELFKERRYLLEYKILSDYYLNLQLYLKKIQPIKVDEIIALVGTSGISKKYNWNLYNEELKIKTELLGKRYYPIFFILIIFKFLIKFITSFSRTDNTN